MPLRLFYQLPLFQARRDRIEFKPVEINKDVAPLLVRRLVAYAGCEEVVPLIVDYELQKARSGLFTVPETGDRLKGKGAFGLSPYGHRLFEIVPPCPEAPRAELPEQHMKVNADFTVEPVEGGLRALFSLSAAGADKEYLFGKRLAKFGLAMPPVLRGQFYLRGTDQPEKDFYGHETGAVFHRHRTTLKTFSTMFPFLAIDLPNGHKIYYETDKSFREATAANVETAVRYLSEWTWRMGTLRRGAIFDAGIMRHAGHSDNFLWDTLLLRAYLHDLDSCLAAGEIPVEMRSPYLVRDIASDIVYISKYTIKELLTPTLPAVVLDTAEPVQSYLKGLLGNEFDERKHGVLCRTFAEKFGEVLERPDLALYYLRKRWVELNGQAIRDPIAMQEIRYTLDLHMDSLWRQALQLAFYVARNSAYAAEKDFKISNIDDAAFAKSLSLGLRNYIMSKKRKLKEGQELLRRPPSPSE